MAGHYDDGLEQVASGLRHAELLEMASMTAALHQVEGLLLEANGAFPEAKEASVAAYMGAAKASAWGIAADAARDLSFSVGYDLARHDEGVMWSQHAEVAAHFSGDPLQLGEALRCTNLAAVHFVAGEFEKSLALDRRSLELRREALGDEHPLVASALNNLAGTYRQVGSFSESKALFEEALALREKSLGPDHPQVALTLGNLALVLFDLGDYEEAKKLSLRCLAAREEIHGAEHPFVANALNNLGITLAALGELREAKEAHLRALAIKERTFGAEHPQVATSMANLAALHRRLGELDESEALHRQALALRERVLDPNHYYIASSLAHLGALAIERGRAEAAIPMLERAVTILDQHEGEQDSEFEARFDLARAILASGGDRSRATMYVREAVDGFAGAGPAAVEQLAEAQALLEELTGGASEGHDASVD